MWNSKTAPGLKWWGFPKDEESSEVKARWARYWGDGEGNEDDIKGFPRLRFFPPFLFFYFFVPLFCLLSRDDQLGAAKIGDTEMPENRVYYTHKYWKHRVPAHQERTHGGKVKEWAQPSKGAAERA